MLPQPLAGAGRGVSRAPEAPTSALIPSWHPRILEPSQWNGLPPGDGGNRGVVGEKLAAGSARPGLSPE